ncbi:unnamed protein product [Pleuronectes platessa]|uniref:Uncharacterized protein n=1 Tax=Pleuronectes platessa TaxID=8262 RepID=A0A9N7U2I0_PLEPL|nr:unnamed protein product [Pleuronectes platessa]
MEYGHLRLKARHSIEERSGIGRGDSFSSARCMTASPPPRPELRAFSINKSDDDVSEEDSDTSFDYEADAMFQEGRDITLDNISALNRSWELTGYFGSLYGR